MGARFPFAFAVVMLLVSNAVHAGDVRYRMAGIVPFPSDGLSDRTLRAAVPRPPGLDRVFWDQLVFDALDNPSVSSWPLERRRTHALTLEELRNLDIFLCLTSDDDISLFRENEDLLHRWLGAVLHVYTGVFGITHTLDYDRRCRIVQHGVVVVRVGTNSEFAERSAIAFAETGHSIYPDGSWAGWHGSGIVFNPDYADSLEDVFFYESLPDNSILSVLLHEFGHVLGFWHVDDPTSWMSTVAAGRDCPQTLTGVAPCNGNRDILHTQLVYDIGPGEIYPGFDEEVPVPALPLTAVWLLAALLTTTAPAACTRFRRK